MARSTKVKPVYIYEQQFHSWVDKCDHWTAAGLGNMLELVFLRLLNQKSEDTYHELVSAGIPDESDTCWAVPCQNIYFFVLVGYMS